MSLQTSSQIDEVCLFTLKDTKSLQLNDENDPNSIVAPKTEPHPHSFNSVIGFVTHVPQLETAWRTLQTVIFFQQNKF